MASVLLAQINKAREVRVAVGAMTFLARRPTVIQMVDYSSKGVNDYDVAMAHVYGWEGVTEDDIVGGGTKDPIPFDADVMRAWAADRPEVWQKIAEELLAAYHKQIGDMRDAAKN